MAYPDYSVVVVDVTTGGITEPVVFVHFDEQVSKKVYRDAILAGNRAFYYEKPKPTLFQRNDTQPIINATAAEAAVLASATPLGFTKDPVADAKVDEWIDYLDAQFEALPARWNAVQSGSYRAGERIGEKFFNALNNFYYNTFAPWAYKPNGELIAQVTVENYTYKLVHNGLGGVVELTINNCPSEGTVLSTATNAPYTTTTSIGGVEITLGTYNETVTADGNCLPISNRTYTWSPEGTVLGQRITEEQLVVYFKSTGWGWYYEELAGGGGGGDTGECPAAGQETNPETRSTPESLYYLITSPMGVDEQHVIGSTYTRYLTNGTCGEDPDLHVEWLPVGTVITSFTDGYVTTRYLSNGNGGATTETEDNTPTPEEPPPPDGGGEQYCLDNPTDPMCQCPTEGATADNHGVTFPEIAEARSLQYPTGTFEGAGIDYWDAVADGNCNLVKVESSLTTEWLVQDMDIIGGSASSEALNADGGEIYCKGTNGSVIPISVNAFIAATPQSNQATIQLNPLGYAQWVLPAPPLRPQVEGRIKLTDDELLWKKYKKGDYRLTDTGAFVCVGWAPRTLWGVTKPDNTPSGSNTLWWTTQDAEWATIYESQSIKAKYPESAPYSNGFSHISTEVRAKTLIPVNYVVGVIYSGRQIAWTSDVPIDSPTDLYWHYEEFMILRGAITRDSRWTAPTVSKAAELLNRTGYNGEGYGGSTYASHTPPYKACCPIFRTEFTELKQFDGSLEPKPAPKTLNSFAKGSLLAVGGGQSKQLYRHATTSIKLNGTGGLEFTTVVSTVDGT